MTHKEEAALRSALRLPCPFTVGALKDALGWRRSTTRAVLEELELLGLMARDLPGKGARWRPSWLLRGVGEDAFAQGDLRPASDF